MFLPKNPQKTDVHKSRFSMWFIILHQNERMFFSRERRMIERMKLRQWRWRENNSFSCRFLLLSSKREREKRIFPSILVIIQFIMNLSRWNLKPSHHHFPSFSSLAPSLHFFLQSSPFFSIFSLVFSFSASFSSPVIHAHLTGFPWEKGEESEQEIERERKK